jgi:glycosyltransferase involved in cell wall biosynthesis
MAILESRSSETKKRIVIVSEFFYPNKTGSSKVLTELAEDLSSYGMDVEVVTSRKIYNEENQELSKTEDYKGIKINRVWTSKFNKDSSVGRILNYFIFSLSVFFSLLFKGKSDQILFVSNPPTVPVAGYFLNLLKGQKYSYLIHDLYPDIAVAMGIVNKTSFFVKIFDCINSLIFKRVEKVIVLGNDMKKRILDKGVPEETISIITNWADISKIKPVQKINEFSIREGLSEKFVVLYTGNMGKFHQLEVLVDAAELLKEERDIVFVFVGEGFKKGILQGLVKEKHLSNVRFYSYQPDEIYQEVLATGDLLVTSLEKGVEGTAVPSKTYSYLAGGKPILGIMNDSSEIGSMIIKYNLGINMGEGNAKKIAAYILEISQDKNKINEIQNNVKTLFKNQFQRHIVTRKYFDLFANSKHSFRKE